MHVAVLQIAHMSLAILIILIDSLVLGYPVEKVEHLDGICCLDQ